MSNTESNNTSMLYSIIASFIFGWAACWFSFIIMVKYLHIFVISLFDRDIGNQHYIYTKKIQEIEESDNDDQHIEAEESKRN